MACCARKIKGLYVLKNNSLDNLWLKMHADTEILTSNEQIDQDYV